MDHEFFLFFFLKKALLFTVKRQLKTPAALRFSLRITSILTTKSFQCQLKNHTTEDKL